MGLVSPRHRVYSNTGSLCYGQGRAPQPFSDQATSKRSKAWPGLR